MKKYFLFFARLSVIMLHLVLSFGCRDMIHDISCIKSETKPVSSYSMVSINKTNNNGYNLKPYKINAYETTYALWYTVRLWAEDHGYNFVNKGSAGQSVDQGECQLQKYKPVTHIKASDIIVWCNAFSEKKGLVPAYYSDEGCTVVIRALRESELANVHTKVDSNGFRLPTTSEWIYASHGAYITKAEGAYKFSGSDNLMEVAVAYVFSGPNCVGTKKPNGIGCYDMTGNVSEICLDDKTASALGGHCANDNETHLKLPGSDLYYIVSNYPYFFGFRFVQTIYE